jgi:hypothetical protein
MLFSVKIVVFCVVSLFGPIRGYQRFCGTCCFRLQGLSYEKLLFIGRNRLARSIVVQIKLSG